MNRKILAVVLVVIAIFSISGVTAYTELYILNNVNVDVGNSTVTIHDSNITIGENNTIIYANPSPNSSQSNPSSQPVKTEQPANTPSSTATINSITFQIKFLNESRKTNVPIPDVQYHPTQTPIEHDNMGDIIIVNFEIQAIGFKPTVEEQIPNTQVTLTLDSLTKNTNLYGAAVMPSFGSLNTFSNGVLSLDSQMYVYIPKSTTGDHSITVTANIICDSVSTTATGTYTFNMPS